MYYLQYTYCIIWLFEEKDIWFLLIISDIRIGQRSVFFIALIICKSKCIAEYSLYELNFDQGKKNKIYRHRSVF